MRGLHVVEQHHVLQLHAVADDGVLADDGAAADEGAVADLRAVVDDAGRAEVSRGEDLGVLGDPDALGGVVELLGVKRGAELQDEALDLVEHLPGIGLARKELLCDRLVQIEQILDFYHGALPLI